jgi:LysR family transcriptional activator of nhaA
MAAPLHRLNFHHLHYFWAVAHEGNLTRAAARLRVAQSALSAQVRQLEESLGEDLFAREGRGLVLTEAGKLALAYADDIFAAGSALLEAIETGRAREERPLRVGAVATLSRNFQESFLRPVLGDDGARLHLESGRLDELVARLEGHALDLVLANRPARSESAVNTVRSRRIARQPVSLVGPKRRRTFRFPEDLEGLPVILPGSSSDVRSEFDVLCQQRGVRVHVLAEVDDMATMRLLARTANAVTLVPTVVVRDELRTRQLHEYGVVPGLFESFYAITVERRFEHPLVGRLLARKESELLAMTADGERDGSRKASRKTNVRA